MPRENARPHPVVLVIRDGWGENPDRGQDACNAVRLARTPVADRLADEWPVAMIRTCGEDVGLPAGTMGNSEVGHQNIGAGRVVPQEIMRITGAIHDGSFFDNAAFHDAFDHARRTGGRVHVVGLVSDGQVHSDLEHLFALIDLAARREVPADGLQVHALTDGRDTGPRTGLDFIRRVESRLREAGVGRIASVIGRYYAMDRDHRWDRVAHAYRCLTGRGEGEVGRSATSAEEAVTRYYDTPSDQSRVGDEFILATPIGPADGPAPGRIASGDAVIFFNFRGDRPREITKAFVLDAAAWAGVTGGGFDRGDRLDDLHYCCMTGYEKGIPVSSIAFHKLEPMPSILGEVIADRGLRQFRCAETEKFPHVTFFFNDYREEPFAGERRTLLDSPKDVATYDQKPEMSAQAVCEAVLERLAADDCESLLVVNFANPDMVGHTGKLDAVVRAVEITDACVGRIVDAVLARDGAAIITADHGNAEQMWDSVNDCPHTAHTTCDVPLIGVGPPFGGRSLRTDGRLADIAPTLLALLDIEQPEAMTGESLIASEHAATQ